MRGHLFKQGKGSWTIVLPQGRDPETGKRRQKWITVQGPKRHAERKLVELLHQADMGIPIVTGRLKLRDYLETWLRDVVAVRNRARTVEGYATIVHRHIVPVLGDLQLTKLQAGDVERLEAKLLASGLGPNTVHHVHVALSKALKDAERKGLVQRNVCQAVDPPKPGRYEVNCPEIKDINRILDLAQKTPYHAALHFMAFTGIRRGEAIALKWKEIDLDREHASITETAQRVKGKGIVVQPTKSAAGRRGIDLDPITVGILRSHRGEQVLRMAELDGIYQDQGLVFPGPLGELLDPSVLTRNFKKLARRAGLPGLRLHDLRHGHAAGLIQANTHVRVVQERLGHASAAFTMQVYGHVAAGLQKEAAKAFANLMKNSRG